MTGAPTPGVGEHKERVEAAQTVVTITVRGEAHSLAPLNLPLQEALICRKATGLPLEAFYSGEQSIGMDSVKVLWWLARRAGGEFSLTLDRAWGEWPDDLGVDEFTVEVNEPGGDDPEA